MPDLVMRWPKGRMGCFPTVQEGLLTHQQLLSESVERQSFVRASFVRQMTCWQRKLSEQRVEVISQPM